MNRKFLERLMKERGVTYYRMKRYHHFSPDTLISWEKGDLARPASLKKLAEILGIDAKELTHRLKVNVMPTRTSHELTDGGR